MRVPIEEDTAEDIPLISFRTPDVIFPANTRSPPHIFE